MAARYGLKSLEYLFYALALSLALPLLKPEMVSRVTSNDLIAIIFLLVGLGVLIPRAIAYSRWKRVVAQVGAYSDTWDGEQKAGYSYEFGGQRYSSSFRSMYGSSKHARLLVCINPHAPWVRYPVFWNVWLFGAAMLGLGAFLLFSDHNYFG